MQRGNTECTCAAAARGLLGWCATTRQTSESRLVFVAPCVRIALKRGNRTDRRFQQVFVSADSLLSGDRSVDCHTTTGRLQRPADRGRAPVMAKVVSTRHAAVGADSVGAYTVAQTADTTASRPAVRAANEAPSPLRDSNVRNRSNTARAPRRLPHVGAHLRAGAVGAAGAPPAVTAHTRRRGHHRAEQHHGPTHFYKERQTKR